MIAVFLLFTAAYWTQIPKSEGTSRKHADLVRIRQAVKMSFNTSWKLDYGRKHARTILFKVVTSCQSIVFKLMFLSLLQVISNPSPLLNTFIGKLLPL